MADKKKTSLDLDLRCVEGLDRFIEDTALSRSRFMAATLLLLAEDIETNQPTKRLEEFVNSVKAMKDIQHGRTE